MNFQKLYGFIKNNGISNAYFRRVASNFNACADRGDSIQKTSVQWQRFPKLNWLLEGHRRGELTVLSGKTGCGKTTFVSEYSLDLATRGVKTLWGSFEVNNVHLMKVMLNQYAQIDLENNVGKFDEYYNHFAELPLHFMSLSGEISSQRVFDVVKHSVYIHEINHVVVDSLQYMSDLDEADCNLKVISAFKNIATQANCHITLVIHPHEEPMELLSLSSIFRSEKEIQEVDNVLLIQTSDIKKGRKFIQVAKNKYNGKQGTIPLQFNRECQSFASSRLKNESPKIFKLSKDQFKP